MKTNRLLIVPGIVVAILLIPLVAMQFTTEVNWNLTDFVVAHLFARWPVRGVCAGAGVVQTLDRRCERRSGRLG